MKSLKIGTRGSQLALAQTEILCKALTQMHPHLSMETVVIHTQGDTQLEAPLGMSSPLDKGAFTKELEMALLREEIHVAVHSLKDLPTENTPGLTLAAILPRASTNDILITKCTGGFSALPSNARVATSSMRRRAQILRQRPDLIVENIRGNVPTRIRKLAEIEGLTAIVLAAAGLERLQLLTQQGLCQKFKLQAKVLEDWLPAPGQGAIAVQAREVDTQTCHLLASIHDPITAECVHAERLLLEKLGGGCHLALGALAKKVPEGINLQAIWWKDPQCPASYRETTATGATAREVVETVFGTIVV